jgi:flagellar biosynthesis/type III secretory pathway chaperone
MTAMWEKFIVLLNQTLEIYEALLLLSRKKRQVLVEVKQQELEQLTKQEELLIIKAGQLETLRKAQTQELITELGLSPEQAQLAILIEHADSQTAGKLEEISEEFTEIAAELVELNELNEKLIKQSLELVNYNINILSQNTADSTYAPKGKPGASGSGRSILDTKA